MCGTPLVGSHDKRCTTSCCSSSMFMLMSTLSCAVLNLDHVLFRCCLNCFSCYSRSFVRWHGRMVLCYRILTINQRPILTTFYIPLKLVLCAFPAISLPISFLLRKIYENKTVYAFPDHFHPYSILFYLVRCIV